MTHAPPIHRRAERLPQESITLCFSDVEESTPLMQRIPEQYAEVLVTQRGIVRDAILENHGLVLSAEGEELYSAFPSAIDGVRAAIAAQRATMNHAWTGDARLRVRIGLHTGTPVWTSEEYVGLDVVRASRVMSAGYGGQVLISGTTHDALGDQRDGFDVSDLGQHRLKGLQQLERIYQVTAEGLPAHFPPPKTLTQRPVSVPIPATPLLGRETELADIQALLGRSEVRLVTLTGTGGMGKTRLATEVANLSINRFADGVVFVPLAPVREPAGVVPAIAQALELNASDDLASLRSHLRERHILLVLDNCEHVIEAVGDAASLLASCPRLRILATSREPLHRAAEREYRVSPLRLPMQSAGAAEIATSPAVRLFVERASALRPGFAVSEANAGAVARICARMSGLPLAIELVAARSRLLTPTQLLARLDDPLAIAARGPRDLPERQQSLEATISWSYDLLPEDERTVFRHLAVFAGGFTMEAAEAVVPDAFGGAALFDHLEALTAKSLITLDDAGEQPRFSMLEMLREYGNKQLERAGEASEARTRHLKWYRDFCTSASRMTSRSDQVAAIATEAANIRAALGWAVTSPDGATVGLSLAIAAGIYWWQRSAPEGARWLRQLLDRASETRATARTLGLYWQAFLSLNSHLSADAVEIATRSVEASQVTPSGSPAFILARNILGDALTHAGDPQRGVSVCLEAVASARTNPDRGLLALTLYPFGTALFECGDYEAARKAWQESCDLFGDLGDESLRATPLGGLARLAVQTGDLALGERLVGHCLQLLQKTNDLPRVADAMALLARIRTREHRLPEARTCLEDALSSLSGSDSSESEEPMVPAWSLTAAAEYCASKERWFEAVALIAAARVGAQGSQGRAVDRSDVRAISATAQARLPREEYRAAEARGRGLDSMAAIQFALQVVRNV